ncbi:MAG: glycosyltransferase [Planctomycetales bacterium]|nr:glycosyltransferase [Planctomycetales bacterium]
MGDFAGEAQATLSQRSQEFGEPAWAIAAESSNSQTAADHDLTLVIPAYNEERRLGPTLDALESYLDRTKIDYRILVVDDGSQDATARVAQGRGHRFETICLERHLGKGAAVRTGMLAARGAVVGFTDADLPYSLDSIQEGFDCICQSRCEVVFGARDLTCSIPHVRRRLSRQISTAVFSRVAAALISREVTDTQCGLKLFSGAAARAIFSRATINGFAFDAEVVLLTERLRLSYLRVPVSLVNECSSTLTLRRHALPMLRDLFKVWGRHTGRLAFASPDSYFRLGLSGSVDAGVDS